MTYCTAKQAAAKWGITANRVTILCKAGRIDGAYQVGAQWLIPADAEKPADGRTGQANKKKETDFFRFPFYVTFGEKVCLPPLSEEEQRLRNAQLALFACDFDRAEVSLTELAAGTESVYIRISALFFGCVLSMYSRDGKDFNALFTRMSVELEKDFPHKREMALFRPWLYFFRGEYKIVSDLLDFAPDYGYAPECYPLMILFAFSCYLTDNQERFASFPPDLYEIECRKAEQSGHYYEAQEMHYLLVVVYQMKVDHERMMYHLGRAVAIARDHGLLLLAAGYAAYFPEECRQILRDYPTDFSERLRCFADVIHESFCRFASHQGISIYKELSKNEYRLVNYAAMGYSNRRVAEILNLSERTIANRYSEIYAKLGITGKKELAAMLVTSMKWN